jgi:hypothetical protein
VVRRNTNRKHMIGDHHGRVADTATLLLTAMDEILGTHTSGTAWTSLEITRPRRSSKAPAVTS